MPRRSIRAGQLISPFGVGAVVDLGTESFTSVDISHWPHGDCPIVQDNPLRSMLGKDVRSPPDAGRGATVPVWRFPRWLFCPTCRHLTHLTQAMDAANDGRAPTCPTPTCQGAALNPMRFVAACENGHLQDVDWHRWAHRNNQAATSGQCSRQTSRLKFNTTGASGGDFNAMTVTCTACGSINTLEGLTQGPYVFGCGGRQPWQDHGSAEACGAYPRVFPRAASSVYYAQTRSAIDLDASSRGASADGLQALRVWLQANSRVGVYRKLATSFPRNRLEELCSDVVQEAVRNFRINEDEARAEVIAVVLDSAVTGAAAVVSPPDDSQHGILRAEWPQISRRTAVTSRNLQTSVQTLDEVWPQEFSRVFEQVTLIARLREVRALIGFRRVKPDQASRMVASDLGAGAGWLPGIETFGEGVFLKFREATVADWEQSVRPAYARRSSELEAACARWGRTPAAVHASPRFVALHTFAHGLIRRLAFDAGYSAASIRERIYCDLGSSPAAGVMLYTADGDSEGSLGGLVRQGEPGRLLGTLRRTLADLAWCSSDPVCIELEAQGVDGLNSAACHACCLVSETSCAYNNSLLDRRLLVGAERIPGLLEDSLAAST
jgi:hypothetical protein